MAFNLKVKKASSSRSTFRLSFPHLQSAEFMENNVILSKYMVPTDHFKIDPAFESRCAALQNPAFVNTNFYLRCFYVPHSVVWHRFNDWVTGNPTYITGTLKSDDCPFLTDTSITLLFVNDSSLATQLGSYTGSEWQTYMEGTDRSHAFDFAVYSSPNYKTYKLTNKGRYIYKLLRSLGYNFVWTLLNDESAKYNALALLSYFRIFLDYFLPSVKVLSSACNKLCSFYYNTGGDLYQDPTLIKDCFSEVYHCFYPSSYLTSSWQSPTKPILNDGSSLSSNEQIQDAFNPIINYDINSTGSQQGYINNTNRDGSFILSGYSSQNPWVQRNVQRVVDWLTRSRFVGSEQLLNILSRFGVKPKTPLAHTARFIGSYIQPLMVQDVNSTSNTFDEATDTGSKLGEYAGKMFTQANDKCHFEVNSDDYGCVIITSMIAPADIYYWQGVEREVLNYKPMQFYQPEFDSVGFEVLSSRELMSGFYMPGTEGLTEDQGIGFVPRYANYKVPSAKVSGDFAVPTLNELMDSFHHFRSIYKYGRYRDNNVIHYNGIVPNTGNKDDVNDTRLTNASQYSAQTSLLTTSYDKNQFNRIFNAMDDGQDHIFTMYYFNIEASRPMRSIADSLITLDGDNEKIDVNKSVIEN